MKTLLILLGLAALPAPALPPGGRLPLPPISLYTHFVQDPPPAVLNAMQREVQTIMAPMGLRFAWRDLAAYDVRETSVELAVIQFQGRCDVGGLLARDINPGPLGWTHISDGTILPFADVDCLAVRGFLQKELYFMRPEDREAAFGRALGRVLAHELYHIFANTTRHGAEGVARESYSVNDLLARDFQFQSRETQALIGSKAYAALVRATEADNPDALRH